MREFFAILFNLTWCEVTTPLWKTIRLTARHRWLLDRIKSGDSISIESASHGMTAHRKPWSAVWYAIGELCINKQRMSDLLWLDVLVKEFPTLEESTFYVIAPDHAEILLEAMARREQQREMEW